MIAAGNQIVAHVTAGNPRLVCSPKS